MDTMNAVSPPTNAVISEILFHFEESGVYDPQRYLSYDLLAAPFT